MITGSPDAYITGNGTVTFNCAPITPTNLTVSNITTSSAILSFDPAPSTDNVLGYSIYNNGLLLGKQMGQPSSITLEGLTSATNYSISIDAFNAFGNSAMTTPVEFTTL